MNFSKKRAKLPEQPDLILIITDQERATQNFPEGWEKENLKTMTFLKDNGFTFNKAFCNSCMCSPSRTTLFTGVYPSQHGVTQTLTFGGRYSDAETQLDPRMNNIARMLSGDGYDVQYRGKWHLSKGETENGLTASEIALTGFKGWIAPDAGEDVKPQNFGGGYANHDEIYIQQGIDFLRQVRTERESGAKRVPFCLVLSLVNPHDVLAYPNGVNYGYSKEDWSGRSVGLPYSVNEDLLKNEKPMAQFQIVQSANILLGDLPTDDDKLNYINFYAHTLTKIDKQIGEFIDELYLVSDKGNRMADEALLIRISDHGEMGLAHGGMRQKAFNVYEETLNVPMVFSNPILFPSKDQNGVPIPQRTSNELASLIDIMPTMAEIANVKRPSKALQGNNLLPIITDGTGVQDEIMFTFDDTKASSADHASAVLAANRIRCIRTKEWKYSYYFHALGSYPTRYELYRLTDAEDNEMENLAYNPEYAAIRIELAKKLHDAEKRLLHRNAVSYGPIALNRNN
ncbi:sulfatase-like hydrolase/transferase [Kordia sp. YSTF-M3]|uniref:Sulfatase-like hydrolase/transferase n=1 Tax=Kordia aestuariivivens TaxID=2759037 RepID=A0ABR7Q4B0_9FLAO|nr:sulfatase-like hydrolase/transferase [Kordia aestuariivivens]MBC8753400.1 sulfatase-like hydrolase/transferase [Kordia aestuariivivens]